MSAPLRVLALEPWLGGSHERFLGAWRARSAHAVEVLGLPARHWKWRMEGGAWALARRLAGLPLADVLVVSDYVDLARLRGLAPPEWAQIPALVYFHENQLTYPLGEGEERDLGHGFTNVLTCLAAEAIAFNSEYHRSEFEAAARQLLAALPRPAPRAELAEALAAARVVPPGIELEALPLGPGGEGPLRVVFNQRWEHDKDPLAVLRALSAARARGAALELVLLGPSARELPAGVAEALEPLTPIVRHRGPLADRAEYARHLGHCDLVISCARHEFYGMAVLEALACGAAPLLPRRLAYPEVLPESLHAGALYDSSADLVERLVVAARDPLPLRDPARRRTQRAALARHDAAHTARALDGWVEQLARGGC